MTAERMRIASDDSVATGATVKERIEIGTARVDAFRHRSRGYGLRVGDLYPEERSVPVVEARHLSPIHVASALQYHGSLVVTGLLDGEAVRRLRAHLHPDPLRIFGLPLAPEVDAMVADLAMAYEASGLLQVVRDYFQEPPVAAAHRIVVRRTGPGTAGLAWHQDGQFFGKVGALNVWTALDDCGLDRPSLNFVPRRVNHLITPGRTDVGADSRIEAAVSELLADRPFAEPALRAGDAIIFDEMTVHRTGTRPWTTPHRDVAVTWFFAPSRFPQGPALYPDALAF